MEIPKIKVLQDEFQAHQGLVGALQRLEAIIGVESP
jgi:hypothetical protein